LSACCEKGKAFDLHFFAFHRRELLRVCEDAALGGAMNIASRVLFERLRREARQSELVARAKQVEFWAQMLERRPSLEILNRVSREVTDSMAAADLA